MHLVCIVVSLIQWLENQMKAEDNVVDNWIKQSVRREILYRLVVWCLITVIAFIYKLKRPNSRLDKYVTPVIHKLIEQLDFIWAFLYFFITISFFFKDGIHEKRKLGQSQHPTQFRHAIKKIHV
jgi:uncharacterized membrane protein